MIGIDDIKLFHKTFNHPIKPEREYLSHFATPIELNGKLNPSLDDPNYLLRVLRTKLITEESGELQEACDENDPVKYLDALWDIYYVVVGAMVSLGAPEQGGDIVQSSNMSKGILCESCGATGKITKREIKSGALMTEVTAIDCEPCNGTGTRALKRADGKILKGPNFRPPEPELAALIHSVCGDL